jgi:predicted AAA+ superfamily ATPase
MEIKRDFYLDQIVSRMHNGLIKIITGVRRCGKSYLLFHLFVDYLKSHGVDDKHIISINLEDRRNQWLRDPDKLLSYIDGRLTDQDIHYILLDEIQLVEEFVDVLNSYLNVSNADIYVTGSNSRMLSSDVITEFRGRGDEIRLHPLSYREYATAFSNEQRDITLQRYMTYGGLPYTIQLSDDRRENYLKTLFSTTYLKDIKERNHVQSDADLEELVDVLASNVGSLTSPTVLQNTFRSVKHSDITFYTVKNYLDMLQDAFLISRARKYDLKGKKYIDSPSKFYFDDLGLRNACLDFHQLDEGHLMENLIYNELCRKDYRVDVGQIASYSKSTDGKTIRQNLEVDFVCNKGMKRVYVQSAFDMPTHEKIAQEKLSLRKINDNFSKVIVVGGLTPTHLDEDGILVANIFDFLTKDNLID